MIYRDSKTGRLVSKATWKRSKSRGGKRYKRERPKQRRKTPTPKPPPPKPAIFEWLVTFSYRQRIKSLDVIVTARDENQAIEKALKFLYRDGKAAHLADKFTSVNGTRLHRGREIEHHNPTEWRSKSKR